MHSGHSLESFPKDRSKSGSMVSLERCNYTTNIVLGIAESVEANLGHGEPNVHDPSEAGHARLCERDLSGSRSTHDESPPASQNTAYDVINAPESVVGQNSVPYKDEDVEADAPQPLDGSLDLPRWQPFWLQPTILTAFGGLFGCIAIILVFLATYSHFNDGVSNFHGNLIYIWRFGPTACKLPILSISFRPLIACVC